jgi:hypothetical protein
VYAAIVKLDALVIPTRLSVDEGFPIEGFKAFGHLVRTDAGGKLLEHNYDKLGSQLDYFETVLAAGEKYPDKMPVFSVGPKPSEPMQTVSYFFIGDAGQAGDLPRAEDTKITITTNRGAVSATRIEAITALKEAINPYQLNANAYTAFKTRVKLLKLADDWDAYFEKGRPQTFWDISVTTLLEYKYLKKDELVGPPKRQWFVLHPNVVIENLRAAPAGDRLGGALTIEWIGVNWWNLKIPFGVSLTSLYSDRPGVRDVGHGLTLYFANKYCIGWANHGGDNGFFVSLDALKLVDSKKAKLEQYRDLLGQKLGR